MLEGEYQTEIFELQRKLFKSQKTSKEDREEYRKKKKKKEKK